MKLRRWLAGILVVLSGSGLVAADTTPVAAPAVASDAPAVINHPTTGWELGKSFVNYLEPGADFIVPFTKGGTAEGFSGALYTFTSHGFPIASIRAGYGLTDPITYGTLALDLPGLVHLLPASIRGVSPGALNGALALATKFLRVGPVIGYRWDTVKPVYGLSVGAALTTTF